MAADGRIGVLHLVSGLTVGGAERMILWSARTHDRLRFRLGVVSLRSGDPLAASLREAGVPVFELGWGRIPGPAALLRLRRAVAGFAPAVIQGHMFHGNLLARLLAATLPGTAALSTRHTDREAVCRRLLNRATLPLAAGTVAFSRRVAEAERGDRGDRRPVWLLPYGIPPAGAAPSREEARRGLGIPPGAAVLAAAGRLLPVKGFDLLLEAFAALPREGEGPLLLLAGEGPEEAALGEMARRLGVEDRILHRGYSAPLPSVLAAADGFVLSSRREGGPLVVLEAMAAGLPVVATRVGAVEEMVEEGRSGLTVPPGDPAALAVAMRKLLAMGEERAEWGIRGRERARAGFSFEETQRRLEDLWDRVAGEKGG